MAQSEILGLFTTPEQYQQMQQMQQRQMAADFAARSPEQQIRYDAYSAGQRFGGGLAGALGAQDPQLRIIAQRQALAKQIDPADPESYMKAANIAAQGGDQPFAMTLAEYAREAQSKMALIAQRGQEKLTGEDRNARAYAATKGRPDTPEYDAAYQERLDALTLKGKEDKATNEVKNADAYAATKGPRGSAEYNAAFAERLDALTLKSSSERFTNEERNANAYAATKGPKGSAEYNTAFAERFDALTLKSDAEKLTNEDKNARAYASTQGSIGSPEYKNAYLQKFNELTSKSTTPHINKVGVAVGTNKPVYLDATTNEQFIFEMGADKKQTRVPYVGGVDQKTATTDIKTTVENKGQTAFSEQLGKLDAKQVADAVNTRDNSIAALNTLNRLNQLDNQGLISGSYASGRVGATNLLNTLGLVSPADSQRLASSENYQKAAGDLVLAALGGKLGAGFSNEDRTFINSLVPQLENSPQARKQLIQFMTRKNQDIVNETTRLEEYARQNNGLKGFKPKIPLAPAATSELSNMTDAQLKAAIAAKRVKAK